jgi:hypothetical protein
MEKNIPEFKVPYVFDKFKTGENYITITECKLALIYLFGKVIKKKEIRKFINTNENDIYSLEEFIKLCNSIQSGLNNNINIINEFYQSLIQSENNTIIDISSFRNKIKKYFPNLPNNIIDQCYSLICVNGKLNIFDLEKYLIDSKSFIYQY